MIKVISIQTKDQPKPKRLPFAVIATTLVIVAVCVNIAVCFFAYTKGYEKGTVDAVNQFREYDLDNITYDARVNKSIGGQRQ